MMLFGVFLLGVVAVPIAGLLGLLVHWLTRGRPGHTAVLMAAVAVPFILVGLTGAAMIVPLFWRSDSDADTGWSDLFRTPLGGGYYATRIDTTEGPAYLDQAGRGGTSMSPENEVRRFGCLKGQAFLQMGEGYIVVHAQARSLQPLPDEVQLRRTLGVSAGQPLPWLSEDDFYDRCSPKPDTLLDRVWDTGLIVLVLALLLGLVGGVIWVRLQPPALHRVPPPRWPQ
ncbi:hypothetical protein [Deinococcus sonorensis]|uniref:Uncharacterized protein n=2 Tax=Deinococcus sonorensis TaxID=309891 RepID=A0AAU7U7S9_9DEIO